MVAKREVSGTMVMGVVSPKLSELKSRQCSLEELQAALVQIIELVNDNSIRTNKALITLDDKKEPRKWRATI